MQARLLQNGDGKVMSKFADIVADAIGKDL